MSVEPPPRIGGQRTLDELDGLLSLAEDVSAGVSRLNALAFRWVTMLVVGAMAIAAGVVCFPVSTLSNADTTAWRVIGVALIVAGSALTLWSSRRLNDVRREQAAERRILLQVADIASSLMAEADPEQVGIVPHTVAKLRLQRIKTSV